MQDLITREIRTAACVFLWKNKIKNDGLQSLSTSLYPISKFLQLLSYIGRRGTCLFECFFFNEPSTLSPGLGVQIRLHLSLPFCSCGTLTMPHRNASWGLVVDCWKGRLMIDARALDHDSLMRARGSGTGETWGQSCETLLVMDGGLEGFGLDVHGVLYKVSVSSVSRLSLALFSLSKYAAGPNPGRWGEKERFNS